MGLVLTSPQLLSRAHFLLEESEMRAGSSSESTRDCLTTSSRLDGFCTSSNSFYGLNSSTSLSSACTYRCVDHSPDLCLIRSPTCSFGLLLPSQFTLSPFHSLLFILSERFLVLRLPLLSARVSVTHCVLCIKNCSRLKVSFSSGWTGSHKRPGKWTPGWCCASLATYQLYVII